MHIKGKYFDSIEIPKIGYTKEYRQAMRSLVRDLENEIRRQLNYPQIGEYWKSETKLYKLIKKLFPNCSVIHHYFPPFLKGQELDIYVEGLRLGIEYQGRQHFEPIDFFGGQEGFKLTQKRDNRKQELCKKNGVILEYFDYSEPLSRDYVASKFKKYIT